MAGMEVTAMVLILTFSCLQSAPIIYKTDQELDSIIPSDDEFPEFPDYSNPTQGNANKFLDKSLSNSAHLFPKHGLEPLTVPGFQYNFESKVLGFIPVRGVFTAKSGTLSGLSSLHRTGDATLLSKDKNLLVKAELGVKNLAYSAECAVNFIFPINLRRMSAELEFLSAYFEISLPMEKEFQPKVTDFYFKDIGRVDVNFNDNGWPFDTIYGVVVQRLLNSIKHTITDTAQPHMLKALNDAFANLKDVKLN